MFTIPLSPLVRFPGAIIEEPAEEEQQELVEEASVEEAVVEEVPDGEGVLELTETVTEEADHASSRRGWQKIKGIWYYYNSKGNKVKGFRKLRSSKGTHWYYFDEKGRMVTGWKKILTGSLKGWHYFDKDGHELFGFQKVRSSKGTGRYYFKSNGVMVTGWHKMTTGSFKGWHYFASDGHQLFGFQRLSSSKGTHRYYFKPNGVMVTGWYKLKTGSFKGWHYFDSDGHQLFGFQYLNSSKGTHRYYFKPNGVMVTGWYKLTTGSAKGWHYFDINGHQLFGWQYLSSSKGKHWYYFDANGPMATGWRNLTKEGKTGWRYFDNNGHELYGWQTIGGNRYYFGTDGTRYANGTWNFYSEIWRFDANGVGTRIIPKYRALLIGETDFNWEKAQGKTSKRHWGDVELMYNMLNTVEGPYGDKFKTTAIGNLNNNGIFEYIRNTFAGAEGFDVSLFFISSHGNESATGQYAGAISTCYPDGALLLSDLANALAAVPGYVVVIIQTCGSGAAVYPNGQGKAELDKAIKRDKAFNEAVIKAFSDADPGVGGLQANTGEFRRENKFFVLTSSAYHQLSWGSEAGGYTCFTRHLTRGIGSNGSMPADADGNGKTTLNELYNYINREHTETHYDQAGNGPYTQQAQVYPANSNFELFRR